MSNFKPVIKWSGSKRSQSPEIIKYFPKDIDTYFEPFVGGGSMLMELLLSDIKVKNYMCSDVNKELIMLWEMIKNNPSELIEHYKILWHELNDLDDDKQRKKEYFYKIRDRFNKGKDPKDFMFLMRTCVNGMPRYNKNGNFNTSFHITRDGIAPESLEKIIWFWSKKLLENNVNFKNISYEQIKSSKHDFMYLDPPYNSTKGMYYGGIDIKSFEKWLSGQYEYVLSFDGSVKSKDYTYAIDNGLYYKHIYIDSGNSNFRRLKTDDKHQNVKESLYIKTDAILKEDKREISSR